ncbi:unnamed protein product [Clavelina lepadiformis]|uniref:Metalloendopeptidase n=1 Tax=Clavelina lepadiformis TaxID=159417 RepID=A0ABP0FEV1_CLALP
MIKLLVVAALLCSVSAVNQRNVRLGGKGGYFTKQATFDNEAALNNIADDEDIFDINQRFTDQHLVDGDVLPHPRGRNAITDTSLYWPTTTIPIQFGSLLPLLAVSGIEDARQEYEMRTCFSFPDRVAEEDYLIYQPRSGCWSYVGKQGGAQTISIGSGCEKMSTIEHEMMHAIGIYHEQSRPDRDGYVVIETQNIDADKVYNFDKYTYDDVDDRRVPYDYNSVMHYGDTSFSNNGEKTIVTIDPAFQDVIGQRRTFSEGDVDMINRMYSCADPLRVSYTCNFDEESVCGYIQDRSGDDIDWIRYVIGETEGKAISANLPLVDNTQGTSGSGSFMLLDTSGKKAGNTGNMASMRLKSRNDKQCLEFGYYMDLDAGSDAALAIYMGTIDQTTGDILTTAPLVTITGDHENYWNIERFTIQAPSYYKLVVAAKTSGFENDVIAIDDISVLDKPCDTNYFVINDFSQLLASTVKGDGVYSPLLYTDEGYAFKILFFPQGSSSSADGYVGMYFALAQGENDNTLTWPFYNHVIRMMVVDQGPDALTRMSQYSNYLTDENGGSVWDQPTTEVSSSWGYASFMPLSDILNTRNFVKNDAVMISINVRDMNAYAREHARAFANQEPAPFAAAPLIKESDERLTEEHKDVNINITPCEQQQGKEEVSTMSTSTVIGITLGCSFAVFVLMSLLILCINQSNKQALMAIAMARSNGSSTYNNQSYEEGKKV